MWRFLKDLRNSLTRVVKPGLDLVGFPELFEQFQILLEDHQQVMELIADLGEKSGGEFIFDRKYLIDTTNEMQNLILHMVKGVNLISSNRYLELYSTIDRIFIPLETELRGRLNLSRDMPYVVSLKEATPDRPELIGGKANALSIIMQNLSLPVPPGFVITTRAWRRFLEDNHLEERIHGWLEAWAAGNATKPRAPGSSSTASWRGWCPRKWPGRSGARRKREAVTGRCAAAPTGRTARSPLPACTRASSTFRPRASSRPLSRCWPASIRRKPWCTGRRWGCWGKRRPWRCWFRRWSPAR